MSLYETDAGMLAVSYVNPGSPAAKAGIVAGDVITHVRGVAEEKPGADDLLSSETPGAPLSVTYARDGKTHEAAIELSEMVPWAGHSIAM
jgi:S1-C subfamily serine protease